MGRTAYEALAGAPTIGNPCSAARAPSTRSHPDCMTVIAPIGPFDGGRVWTSSVSAMAHRLAQWAHNRDMSSSGTGTTRALPGSPFNQPAVAIVTSYAMSDRVSHDRYGLGTVVGTENGNAAVLVNFGPKVLRVALPTTKMVKL